MTSKKNVLIDSLSVQITESLRNFYRALNNEFCGLLWRLGTEIIESVNKPSSNEKYSPGQIARQLNQNYKGLFNQNDIENIMLFAKQFSGESASIVYTISNFLSWSHIVQILHIEDLLEKDFYIATVISEALTATELKKRIKANSWAKTQHERKAGNSILNPAKTKRQSTWVFHNVSEDPRIYYNLMDSYLAKYLALAAKQIDQE